MILIEVITQILTDYATTPKNHMQVLENEELDIIFEYMTQHNQVASIADIFNAAPKAEAKPAEPKKEKPLKVQFSLSRRKEQVTSKQLRAAVPEK